ncbi:Hpt domain-containing response regulator [Magnetofaba australis]|uniref:Uncharacterized protein n=1 Tax=Magnetofaba australis IT-1 TaxID=1434232 RepID=A0A1Y2K2K4_9PROT|nr:response regulator [Magnetofaba australis]OSM02271.1 hypothetical protein MAIT1_02389 [Magnetofaba australis IT-1]
MHQQDPVENSLPPLVSEQARQLLTQLLATPLDDRQRHLVASLFGVLGLKRDGQRVDVGFLAQGDQTETLAPLRVLLVEDNDFTSKMLSRLLSLRGHDVDVAPNGMACLQRLGEHAYDLILMDLSMPNMNGLEATTEIRRHERESALPHTPIVAVTALTDSDHQEQARIAGVDGFHAKPVDAGRLFAEIERVLESRRSQESDQAPLQEPRPGEQIADIQQLLQTVEQDWTLAREVGQMFLDDASAMLNALRDALRDGDVEQARNAAHALKGAAGAFGQTPVRRLALALEAMANNGALGGSKPVFAALESALETMCASIQSALLDDERSA